MRINRYIMECKFHIQRETADTDQELIDTLWNVNQDCTLTLDFSSSN